MLSMNSLLLLFEVKMITLSYISEGSTFAPHNIFSEADRKPRNTEAGLVRDESRSCTKHYHIVSQITQDIRIYQR